MGGRSVLGQLCGNTSIGQLQPCATLLPGRAEDRVLRLGVGMLDCVLLQVVGTSSLPQLLLHQEIREESFKFFLLFFDKGAAVII